MPLRVCFVFKNRTPRLKSRSPIICVKVLVIVSLVVYFVYMSSDPRSPRKVLFTQCYFNMLTNTHRNVFRFGS